MRKLATMVGMFGMMAGTMAMPENNSILAPLIPQQPTLTNSPVEIVTSRNLLAEGMMTDRIVADANTSQGNLGAAAASESQVRYDVAYSICQTVAPANYAAEFVEVANAIYPTNAAWRYYYDRGVRIEASDSLKVTLIDAPKHGVLENGQVYGAYLYKPNKDYFGVDNMTFSVEVKGKVFKVIYSVEVDKTPDHGSPSCPNSLEFKELPSSATDRNKQGSLDILELPNASQYDAETLAQMHSMLSFALGGVGAIGNGSLNIADLQGAAVGQTAGSTITLDTNATGYNWFIDTTPWDSSEFFPTSNPNEWVTKAGNAAEGKMDMRNTRPLWGNLKVG